MDFSFTEEHEAIREVARDFCVAKLQPRASEFDAEEKLDRNLISEMGQLGLLGCTIPEEYGGTGLDPLAYAIILEELGKGCASHAAVVGAHNSLFGYPLLKYGTEEQKKKYLPKISSGEWMAAFSITEPEAGSDAGSVKSTAKEDGDHWVLNGNKIYVTNGSLANVMIVVMRSEKKEGWRGLSAFIVETDNPGYQIGTIEKKMGFKASPTTELIFDEMRIPKENLLGKRGAGFKIAMESLNSGRMSVAASAVGMAQRAFELAIHYSHQRKQFGHPISSFQGIQFHLAEMSTRIEAARYLTYRAAWLKGRGEDHILEASQAKLYASEMATFVTHRAIQVMGGYGYMKDYEVERLYRDARLTELFEGTSEIQKLVIASRLLKKYQ